MNFATLFTDPAGDLSTKRIVGVGAFLCLVVALVAEIAGHPIHDHLIDVFAAIVGAFMAAATVDHFATK